MHPVITGGRVGSAEEHQDQGWFLASGKRKRKKKACKCLLNVLIQTWLECSTEADSWFVTQKLKCHSGRQILQKYWVLKHAVEGLHTPVRHVSTSHTTSHPLSEIQPIRSWKSTWKNKPFYPPILHCALAHNPLWERGSPVHLHVLARPVSGEHGSCREEP